MPPKKVTGRKPPTKQISSNLEYKLKLVDSNELEPSIRSVVTSLMFTSGDAENPHVENEDLVVNMLKNELTLFLEDVLAVHNNKIVHVKLEHMLPLLKTQKGIIHRFIKYLKNRVEMAAFMKTKPYSSGGLENVCGQEMDEDDDDKNDDQSEDGVDPIDDIGEVGGEEGEYLKKKRRRIGTVTSEENLLEEVQKAFSDAKMSYKIFENEIDETYNQHMLALQVVIEDMSGDEYNRFAAARRVSFQSHSATSEIYIFPSSSLKSRKRKKAIPKNNRQLLISWLGNPPVYGESAQVFLAFLAKEIVSEVVGSALFERQKMMPVERGPIRHSFYEEPLRKNQRFRKYGRLLF